MGSSALAGSSLDVTPSTSKTLLADSSQEGWHGSWAAAGATATSVTTTRTSAARFMVQRGMQWAWRFKRVAPLHRGLRWGRTRPAGPSQGVCPRPGTKRNRPVARATGAIDRLKGSPANGRDARRGASDLSPPSQRPIMGDRVTTGSPSGSRFRGFLLRFAGLPSPDGPPSGGRRGFSSPPSRARPQAGGCPVGGHGGPPRPPSVPG